MQRTARITPAAVEVDGWGTVHVRPLTVAEVDARVADGEDAKSQLARGAARVICDAEGQRLFDPDNAEDVALLSSQPWPLLEKVIAASNKLNGRSDAGKADAKNA